MLPQDTIEKDAPASKVASHASASNSIIQVKLKTNTTTQKWRHTRPGKRS